MMAMTVADLIDRAQRRAADEPQLIREETSPQFIDQESPFRVVEYDVTEDEAEQGVETVHVLWWKHYAVVLIEGDEGRIVSSSGRARNVEGVRRHAVDALHMSRMRAAIRAKEGRR